MCVVLHMHQVATLTQVINHLGVALPYRKTAEPLGRGVIKSSVAQDWTIDLQTGRKADDVVIGAVPRRSVHQSGAIFQRDVLAKEYWSSAVTEWVVVRQVGKRFAEACTEHFGHLRATGRYDRGQSFRGHDGQ